MGQTILSALVIFVSTSVDYLIMLIIIFAQLKDKQQVWQVYAGQFLGTGILVGVGLIGAYFVTFIPADWAIGLLGLVPIYMGLQLAFERDRHKGEADEISSRLMTANSVPLYLSIAMLIVASGGDNIGVYVPLFTTLPWMHILIVIMVLAVGTYYLCKVSLSLAQFPMITYTIAKCERVIIPLILIALGLYILVDNGTLAFFFNL